MEAEKNYPTGSKDCFYYDDNNETHYVHAYFTPPRSKKYPVRWLTLWQTDSDVGLTMREQATMEKPLTQTEYRVRDYLLGSIGIGNYVFVNQAEVARELRVHRISVVDAVKRLCDLGILIKGPKSGRSCTFMISPGFCFSGGLGDGVRERAKVITAKKEGRVIHFDTLLEKRRPTAR